MSSHALYSAVAFLRCGWVYVGWDRILWLKRSRTICIDLPFARNLFWCALLEWLPVNMHNRIVCTCVASRHCEWGCAVSGAQPHQMYLHILNICVLFPSVWVIMCILKCCARLNDFSHSEQVWVFTPLWVSMCLFRFPVLPNDFWHQTHVYAFSLLWVTMCIFRCPAWPHDFWHWTQL